MVSKMESKVMKKMRRHEERQIRKTNKKKNLCEQMIMASQNFNGSFNEEKVEEMRLQMQRQHIGITCGQECRHQITSRERWDSGELLITFGTKNERNTSNNMIKEGNVIFLNKYWAKAFLQGGKQKKKYNDRLVTIRLPLRNRQTLYVINCHYPDSGKSKAIRRVFQLKLEQAISDTKNNDIMVLIGDMNASTGIADGKDDTVCGPHGATYQNEAGRTLKATAAIHELVDLITWSKQKMTASYYDITTAKGKQIDRAFVKQQHQHMT